VGTYLLYCPDYRVRNPPLADVIGQVLPVSAPGDQFEKITRLLGDTLSLRPDRIERLVPDGGCVATFHMLGDALLRARGVTPDYGTPGVWGKMSRYRTSSLIWLCRAVPPIAESPQHTDQVQGEAATILSRPLRAPVPCPARTSPRTAP
jgi:hypothetical protein